MPSNGGTYFFTTTSKWKKNLLGCKYASFFEGGLTCLLYYTFKHDVFLHANPHDGFPTYALMKSLLPDRRAVTIEAYFKEHGTFFATGNFFPPLLERFFVIIYIYYLYYYYFRLFTHLRLTIEKKETFLKSEMSSVLCSYKWLFVSFHATAEEGRRLNPGYSASLRTLCYGKQEAIRLRRVLSLRSLLVHFLWRRSAWENSYGVKKVYIMECACNGLIFTLDHYAAVEFFFFFGSDCST